MKMFITIFLLILFIFPAVSNAQKEHTVDHVDPVILSKITILPPQFVLDPKLLV